MKPKMYYIGAILEVHLKEHKNQHEATIGIIFFPKMEHYWSSNLDLTKFIKLSIKTN